jgi:hypothetical protein
MQNRRPRRFVRRPRPRRYIFHTLRLSKRLMSNWPEKFLVGEGVPPGWKPVLPGQQAPAPSPNHVTREHRRPAYAAQARYMFSRFKEKVRGWGSRLPFTSFPGCTGERHVESKLSLDTSFSVPRQSLGTRPGKVPVWNRRARRFLKRAGEGACSTFPRGIFTVTVLPKAVSR